MESVFCRDNLFQTRIVLCLTKLYLVFEKYLGVVLCIFDIVMIAEGFRFIDFYSALI